ncbi:hypothetical protein NDU88_004830 [Pleurodeles waltl]|uniref:Uncharacterized protein n=1 Tax=Pleurodeles waltl TaxID=8319 RepID=A0AAV7V4J6_PLEWA|nr:hypothetical protein NDU88_004830 [Pleurodeles waltl]
MWAGRCSSQQSWCSPHSPAGPAWGERGLTRGITAGRLSPPFWLIFWLDGTVQQYHSLEAACKALRLEYPHEPTRSITKEDPETPETA